VVDQPPKYVSRGGFKLEAALDAFGIDPTGWLCADVGSSTGGFTDCLLQRGAAKIYAIDVGTNILHWKLRNDPRVVLTEKTNARFVDSLPEPIHLAVMDVSFISLTLVLPKVFSWHFLLSPPRRGGKGEVGGVIALIKPQFEAGRDKVGKGGIVRDVLVHEEVIARIKSFAEGQGWRTHGLITSPILGGDGNKEFLIWLRRETDSDPSGGAGRT
jgi:23S rRNA (cytidine1920-2'-O)/16S rRNA (cytidine1409-2'-O)-methyltransferase